MPPFSTRNDSSNERYKFKESTTVSDQPGVVVVNPDGSNIGSSYSPLDETTDAVSVWGDGTAFTELSTASTTNNDLQPATDVTRYRSFSLQLTGTWTGTVRVQGSNDGTNWVSISDEIPNGNNIPSNDLTGTGMYVGNIGFVSLRVRVITGGTGTITGALLLSSMPYFARSINAQQGGTWSSDVNGTPAVTSPSITTSSSTLLAANSSRKAVLISNTDATNPIFINFSGGTAITTNFRLAPGASVVLDRRVPTTLITAIATGGTVVASVTEMT